MELCEPVQVRSVEIANLELFSSLPESFVAHISDRYSTVDYAQQPSVFHNFVQLVTSMTLPSNNRINFFPSFLWPDIPPKSGRLWEHSMPEKKEQYKAFPWVMRECLLNM